MIDRLKKTQSNVTVASKSLRSEIVVLDGMADEIKSYGQAKLVDIAASDLQPWILKIKLEQVILEKDN